MENGRFSWDWGDGNVQNFPPGSNADDRSHTYTQPGTYTVILSVIGDCETDTYQKVICIEPEVTASYTLDTEEGCIPLAVAAQNTIDESGLCSNPTYNWTVTFEDINCNSTSDWEFINDTNANSENPQFLFNNPGNYTVTQNVTTNCGSFSTQKIISVKKPPAVSINPIEDFCQPGLINPTAIIENCTDNLAEVTYNWSFPGGSLSSSTIENPENIAYDTPGVYTITLEVTNECGTNSATQEFEVLEKPVITNLITTQEICSNQSTIAVPLTSSNPNTTYTWTSTTVPNNTDISGFISSGSTAEIPSQTLINNGNIPGNVVYTVTPILNNCIGDPVDVLTVIVNPTPTIVTQPVDSEVCLDGVANQLTIVTQNGVGVPTYQWYSNTTNSNSGGTPITGATISTYDPPTNAVGQIFYYVTIAFQGGCDLISSDVASVVVVQEPVAVANNPIQTVCLDGTPDNFQITLTGGVGNPSYQWYSNTTNSNTGGTLIVGATASTYNPGVLTTISSNYYYVEITLDGVGCNTAISDVFSVEVVTDPVIDNQAIAAQEVCQNASLQDLTITVSRGIASSNFDYQWYSNLTNNNTGGTPIAGANTNTYTPDNTTIGTLYYYVVVTQTESGCEVISTTSEVTITPGPTIVTQPVDSEVCLDGVANQLTIVTQNGVGVPTYQWYSNTTNSNSGGTPITGATISTYDPPTNAVGQIFYYVTIAFQGGCDLISSDVASVVVNEIPVIDTAEITIYSEETFLFDPSSVAGNIVPIGTTYTWSAPTSSNPGTILGSSSESSPQTNISQTLENISSPPEPVTVTYVITPVTPSCTGQPFILIVIVNPSIISNVEITNNSCFESNNGILSTNITGGVPFTSGPPYLISWTGPNSFTSTASTIINLLAGDYILRIEDSNGVFVIEEYTVSQPDLLTITTDVEKNISCFDGNDGAIEVSITGGTAPYTYNWTGDGIVQGSPSQSVLTAGTYSLEVVDDKLCVINQTYILTEPDIIVINTVSKNDILCFGDATGAIEINITGGTPTEVSPGTFEYGYSWTGPNGFTSNAQNISSLLAGTYTIEVTDELGCIERTDIELTQPTAIEIDYTKTDVTCYGEADGSIDISVNGGNPPYQISWSNLGNGFSQSNLSAGNYIATIIDENLCEANVTITIEQPIFFIAPIVSPISCNDANDASIDLNLTGGIAPITILWSDDPSAGIQRNNLSPGSYTVSIIDSDTDQCPIEETFIITNPPELAETSIVNDAIDCDVSNSGSIELNVSGGTLPYTFLWNTGQTSEDIFNIPSGDYSVEIKDSRGCTLNREYTIFRQEPIIISVEETVIPDCNSNTINVQNIPNVTGGFLPYTYSWSSGIISGSNNEIMTTNQSGAYVLTVTDGKGCQESVSIQVDVPEVGFPEFTYESLSLTQYSFVSIQDPIQFFNFSTGNFTNVSWDFGDGSPIVTSLNPEHTYDQVGTFTVTLTVEYDYGCTYQFTQDINVTKGYLLVIPNAFSPNEDGINDVIRPSFRGFTTIRMLVYDTWGTLVYEEEGSSLEGWNGFINEKPAENGNYIMYVNGITFFGQEIKKSTSITILK
ncbi:PKD domain-containing protein [Polaribacter sp.]|nr:PKD domain-containing protein [Polaribacter sp.]